MEEEEAVQAEIINIIILSCSLADHHVIRALIEEAECTQLKVYYHCASIVEDIEAVVNMHEEPGGE
jgi:hypothetical protein